MAGACAAAVVSGAGASSARADTCAADARSSYARVELFRDGDCRGASVSVGFSGSGDRPDFEAFTNYVGEVYDIDDSRDSIAVAPATCVRLFDGKLYMGEDSGLLCAPAAADGLFADLGAMTNRASSMRVCPLSASSGCDAAPAPGPVPVPVPPLPPPPAPNGSPASQDARLSATLVRGRARRTVSFGEGAVARIGLIDAGGRPIAGAALQVLARERRAGSEWQVAPEVTTGADGTARIRLAPGPSRTVRLEYRAVTGAAQPVAVAAVRLDVRAGVTLRISPRRVGPGDTVRFRGRLLAPPSTRLGKLVTLQARERGRWRDFASVRTRGAGRFTARYRFSSGGFGTFPIRAVARADASYPYATGRSRAVPVRVG